MSDSYFLTVNGSGSFCVPPYKTHREGVHKITPEEAQLVLAWKEQHPCDWVTVTPYEPQYTAPELLTGKLTIQDLRYGTDRAVLVAPEDDEPEDDDAEPVYVYPCEHCDAAPFSSAAILRRHAILHHSSIAGDAEDAVREQLAADKDAKAAGERVRTAEPDSVHPAERLSDEPSGSQRPSLWPKGLGG